MLLDRQIEALIFSAEQPITLKEIQSTLAAMNEVKIKKIEIATSIDRLKIRYESENFAFEVVEIAGGFQFLTKGAYHDIIGQLLKQKTKKKLSRAALETLSIIAYKQPVTKTEMEAIRGVSCDYSVQKLLEKELVMIYGRSEGPGRPLLYATSDKFMNYFGMKSLKDLPKLKDFDKTENEIGERVDIEE